ncbi:MAG: PxxKW family cysteine-rich protein [Deltaproteobacteria bacterium]|nr:PxxKW family cysteine-rich protein [Deltaproteobacteria bacterium]
MVCTTVKKDVECIFMTKKGCNFNGGTCHPVVEDCHGCSRASEFSSAWYCTACPEPSVKWKNGQCNLATHVAKETQSKKNKVNPLKASKRKGR